MAEAGSKTGGRRAAGGAALRRVTRLPRLFRDLGARGAIRYIGRQLGVGPSAAAAPQIDLFDEYDFITRPAPDAARAADILIPPGTLNWVIPGFAAGSGGHMTIFRMIWHLEQLGWTSRVVIVGASAFASGAEARRAIRADFMPLAADVSLGEDSLRPAEFCVATEWRTAYSVRRFRQCHHKLYFIQDMEPYFFPHGSHYMLAEATYRFGFIGITVGDWLAETVRRDYAMRAYPFQMGYPDGYQRGARTVPDDGVKRVFFYARHVTPRRGFELGLLALALVHRTLPDAEFVLAGWDVSGYRIPFPHLNAGVVPHAELADLYSQCDVALVLSLTNLSLLPIELMACGCPVVSNRGANVEWQLKHEQNALLADATPEALAAALLRVLDDAELRRRLIENGLSFARAADWRREAVNVAGYLQTLREPVQPAST